MAVVGDRSAEERAEVSAEERGGISQPESAVPATNVLKWEGGAGNIILDGKHFALKQIHWHSPAEHTISGSRYSMEMHHVHESADKKIAVVGILYKIGRPDSFLAEMEKYIKKLANLEEAEEDVGVIDPRHIKRGSIKYYRYTGSLTVPPCTEGVIWTIVKKVRTVSNEQMNLLKEAVHDHHSRICETNAANP